MKSYSTDERTMNVFVKHHEGLINTTGPDNVKENFRTVNNFRKKLTSTWYGLLAFILLMLFVIILSVLTVTTMVTSNTFTKIKVLLLVVLLVVISALWRH
jgi:hypothetical protein